MLLFNLLNESFRLSLDKNDPNVPVKSRISTTLYYTLIVFFSHFLMFLLMTYNLGIIISLILGNMVGYFIFGFRNI